MPSIEEHCEQCERILGDDWRCVHLFMDEYQLVHGYTSGLHRVFRHHWEGIKLAASLFGGDEGARESARRAAELHVEADMGFVPPNQQWYLDKYGLASVNEIEPDPD